LCCLPAGYSLLAFLNSFCNGGLSAKLYN